MKAEYDIIVIGGGPAGLAAAAKASELGSKRVALIDENSLLGGVLPQCIHTGFGIHYLKTDLTGPEFADRLVKRLRRTAAEIYNTSFVSGLDIRTRRKKLVWGSRRGEALQLLCTALIFATGCRERSRFETWIMGDRPAGVYTAGEAQTLMDLYGILPGKSAVIVGSGDVGLIMARRLALEGAEVKAVVEMQKYPSGLARNLSQCLRDFGIPLLLGHAVTQVTGTKRVETVEIAKVSRDLCSIAGTEKEIRCDTLVLATGLIPRSGLIEKAGGLIDAATKGPVVNDFLETTLPGVFAAGNVLLVNDLVDYAAEQGELAAASAVRFVTEQGPSNLKHTPVSLGRNVRLLVPQLVSGLRDVVFYGRVCRPENCVTIAVGDTEIRGKLDKVRPSEMLRFKVLRKDLSIVGKRQLAVGLKKEKRRERA